MPDLWNTPAGLSPLDDVEITPELEREIVAAMQEWENDTEAQAELAARIAPYETPIHWTTLMRVVR